MKIAFLGDISLNDRYVDLRTAGENPFEDVRPILNEADWVVGNLECTVAGSSENERKIPRIKTTADTLEYLKSLKLDVACLANNHISDNLDEGFSKTLDFLDTNGIQHVGAAFSDKESRKPCILEKNGFRIGLINTVHSNTNPKIPDHSAISVNWFDVDQIELQIKELRDEVDFLVVIPHWGGDFELGWYPNPIQSYWGQRLFSAGADAVIGHHSHTFQPYEVNGNHLLFHSLGNFCFSDIPAFSYSVNRKRSLTGGILLVEWKFEDVTFSIYPIKNENGFIRSIDRVPALESRNRHYRLLKASRVLFYLYGVKHKYIDRVLAFLFGSEKPWYVRLRDINLRRVRYYLFGK